jgi:hypothetical protein
MGCYVHMCVSFDAGEGYATVQLGSLTSPRGLGAAHCNKQCLLQVGLVPHAWFGSTSLCASQVAAMKSICLLCTEPNM